MVAERAEVLLQRARALAAGPLDGIETAARVLAEEAEGDLPAMQHARRAALDAEAADPTPAAKQVVSLLRRALEVGDWDWGGLAG